MKNWKYLLIAFTLILLVYGFTRKPRIIDISGSLKKNGNWPLRDPSQITDITIHHSATADTATPESFARYHVDTKGWPGIGYHFVITPAGTIFQTNPVTANSYHNGYNNSVAIGICLIGNFDETTVPAAQMKAARWLVSYLQKKYGIIYLNSHKEYKNATSCPGRNVDMTAFRKETGLLSRVGEGQKNSLIAGADQADN